MNLRPWRWGAGALLSGVVLLVACDGENLFDPDQNPFTTPTISVNAPQSALAGDSMSVSITAVAASDVASISVQVRGAVTKDTTLTVTPARTVSSIIKIGIPSLVTDTLIFVTATATDKLGAVSKARGDTVSISGPPSIISVTPSTDSLKLGSINVVKVRAFGARRVQQIEVSMRGAISKDTTLIVSPAQTDVTTFFNVVLPATVSDTSVRTTITARDVNGLASVAKSVTLPVTIVPPTIALTAPPTATPGANLDMSVRALAMRQVSSIKLELRGALIKDTTINVVPSLADVTQSITVKLPGDLTDSILTVRAFAIDKAGTYSIPSTATTVRLATGVPVIQSVTGPDSVRAGQTADVRIVAQGVRPISEITVRVRGAVTQDIKVPVSPARVSVTSDVSIAVPVDVSDTLLTITAVATDQSGALSTLTTASTKKIKVSDGTAPTVTVSPTPSTTAAGGTVKILISAKDNVALAKVGYAVVNPAGDTIGTTPTLANTGGASKDTTFNFIVPLSVTPRTVRVFGIAIDNAGKRTLSTPVNVVIADSAAPAITLSAPSLNSTLPLNDSVRVQVRVVDPTGVKSVTLSGQSTRVDSLGPTRTVQRFETKIITFPFVAGAPLPRDTTIVRYLKAIADSISEPVSIIASASDSLSNTSTVSTSILVGGPRVELRNPVNGAQVVPGGTLLLTAFAVDRAAGIDSMRISISGAQTQNFTFATGCSAATCKPNGLPSNDSVVVNQNYVVGNATGAINVVATAWNRNRVAGVSAISSVTVSSSAVSDTARPKVSLSMTANDRIELTDTITLNVSAQDVGAAGLRRVGVVVSATPSGTGVAARNLYRDSVFTGSGRTGLQPATFKFTLKDFGFTEVNMIRLPRGITFSVHAFARDTIGNCGANVNSTLTTVACDSTTAPASNVAPKWFIARLTPGLSQFATVVPGFARPLPSSSSVIADVLVDLNPARPRMYLSNQNNNRIEVLNLADSTFASSVSVGSEPWGMFLNNAQTRLMVANSGGTNISFVDITTSISTLAEVPAERILTPNVALFDVSTGTSNGLRRYTKTTYDFSDRPQFVGQDANGIILFSTKPTGAAPDGTVRYLTNDFPRRESKLLYNENAFKTSADVVAIANVDSLKIGLDVAGNNTVNIYDHLNGDPSAVIQSGFTDLSTAMTNVAALGSDIDGHVGGAWSVESIGLSDTTYIAVSGDRQYVGFGEGATGTYSRIWLWQASTAGISDDISVTDLVGNAAERVLGIALNNNGLIGAARGATSTYFFSNDVNFEGQLRLQGTFSNGVAGGNGGVALHPSHVDALVSTSTTLAFIATVNRSIKIVDTFNFRERGEIQIRDNIVGPLRAALPLAAENVGLAECDQIWTKLYGVTGAGKAVIINVRKRDVINPIITAATCPS